MVARQLLNRLLVSIPVLLGVTILGFALMVLIPADPAVMIAGEGASPAVIMQIRRDLGLDEPATVQFGRYMMRLLQGDFGRSILNGTDVLSELAQTAPATLELLFASLCLSVPIGIGMGAAAAANRGTIIDRAVMAIAALGLSMPVFMSGLVLINVVGVQLGALPVQGRGGPLYTLAGLQHIILPATALAIALMGPVARMTRTSMLEVANKDFVRTARAKGIGERRVVIRHILRNALIPTVNMIGLQAGYLLGGVVITETIFAWPGIGRLAVAAIGMRDTPMAQGTILFLALAFVFINIVVDVLAALLDPRARSV